MPLTPKQQKCLDQIKGTNGVISTIGIASNKLELSRGEITPGSLPKDHSLDILAKVFFKAEVTTPVYTSLIHDLSHNVIVISYMGAPQHLKTNTVRALTEEQVNNLITQLQKLQNSDNIEQAKVNLFKEMYKCGNDMLQNQLINKAKEEREKDLYNYENNLNFYEKVHSYYSKDTVKGDEVLDDPLFINFVLENFDKILPNIENALFLLNYMDSNLIINTEIPQYEGVHVEVKGVHFVKEKYPAATKFNIGLAKRDIDPGCCTGCAAEFTAFAKIYDDHSFNRTGDFDCNFPPVNYQPSPLVTSESEVFTEFTQNTSSRINTQKDILNAQKNILSTQIKELKTQDTSSQIQELNRLKGQIQELVTQIQEFKKTQDTSNTRAQIKEFKTQIQELKKTPSDTDAQIQEKKAQIQKLNTQIQELKTQGISTQIQELNAEIGKLHKTMKTNKEEQKEVVDKIQAVENVENHEFFTIFAEMIAENLPDNDVFEPELSDFA